MTPASAPSTIVSNPAPVPIQSQVKTEVTKEDIANEIARQREMDMLRNQVHYMYDQMNEDLKARRSTGEIMANMQARGTNVKPKDFGIDENDEIYKVQKDAAKSKHNQFTLTRHEILDQKEIARKERTVLHDTLSQTLINKLQNMATTPAKHNIKLSISSSYAYEIESNTTNKPKLSTTTSSSFDINYESPPKNNKKTPLKLSSLFDSVPKKSSIQMNTQVGEPMEIESPATPKNKTMSNSSKLQMSPSPPRTLPVNSYTENDFDIIERAAKDFTEKSFEEVSDTVAKLGVKQKIDEFSQQKGM